MKTQELIIVGLVIVVLSFPLMYLSMLLATGNAKLVFKGDLAKKIEVENQTRLQRQDEVRDSLILVNSYSYIANLDEKKRIEALNEKLVKEQDRLAIMRSELEQERIAIEKERKTYEAALAKSSTKNNTRIKKLAKVYGAMKANEAARIMETLDDALCIDIFKYLNEDRQKAKILAAMSGEKASRLSKKMGIKVK
jgi:flagellar motility protein MotE (MotC chaperone)